MLRVGIKTSSFISSKFRTAVINPIKRVVGNSHHASNASIINGAVISTASDQAKISPISKRFANLGIITRMVANIDKDLKINEDALKELNKENGHLNNTKDIAVAILDKLSPEKRAQVNANDLETAAVVHDLGKVLIPSEILNYPGKLEGESKEIMDSHANLGYELLKGTNLNENTLEMVRNHHRPESIGSQIVLAADVYDALKTERPYKKAFSKKESLKIISEEHVETGKLDPEIYEALKKVANRKEIEEKLRNIHSQWQLFYSQLKYSFSTIFTKGNQGTTNNFIA